VFDFVWPERCPVLEGLRCEVTAAPILARICERADRTREALESKARTNQLGL
jgi:hypothetical protein